MNGDLDLSGSLGGLRIANPDDASPDVAKSPSTLDKYTPAISPIPSTLTQNDSSSNLRDLDRGPVSPLDLQYSASSTSPPSSQAQDSYLTRKAQKQPIPATYQDQQQAQFPQYPTMMPQNLHNHQTNATRPVSTFYTQTPPTSNPTNGLAREGSYRTGDDIISLSGVPRRSSSRGSSAAFQAGVPTRDGSHSDRNYKQGSQYTSGNAPVPPRRMSRGIPNTRVGGSPGNGNTPLSSSPYAIEGGPLSSSEEWKERGAAVGVQQDYDANGKPVSRYIKKGVKDFNFGQTLGEGSYSTVLAATDRQTLKEYAIKVLDKRHIIKEKKVKYVNIEKDTLNRLTDHPGVVRLYYTFQDERSLYFVLDLASGGELLGFLKRMSTFDEECTRFYGAQILDTVEYMHKRGVIHRDLKPENVLLDDKMHVKITDFGTAKILDKPKSGSGSSAFPPDNTSENSRASSFVGTAEYVSPELLTDKNACKASDLWAFGCIIYQLLAGRPPFKASNEYQTFQKIVALDYEFPRGFPEVARDLVERLLILDPQRRLSIEHVKNHQFFDGIVWGRGLWQQKAPRLKPYVPPPQPIIKLNGTTSHETYASEITPSHSTNPTRLPPPISGSTSSRPHPRIITELPPPSQLDIEWSPVLTRNNERILKLGNLLVESRHKTSGSPHNVDGGGGGKFSRLFGGNTTKKRQRLVMVTSSGRIIMAAAGGDEKKSKSEISLLQPGTQFSCQTDAKGYVSWTVDTVSHYSTIIPQPLPDMTIQLQIDKRHTFEDPKPPNTSPKTHDNQTNSLHPSTDPSPTNTAALSAQDWLETLSRAKEIALYQSATTTSSSYSYSGGGAGGIDDTFTNLSSSELSSHANTLDASSDFRTSALGQLEGSNASARSLGLRTGDRESNRDRDRGVGPGPGAGAGLGDSRSTIRATLQKHHSSHDRLGGADDETRSVKSSRSKRFSKRQSKGVLAAVF
jgi:3-phosphoinositide dependent protein kinase-1